MTTDLGGLTGATGLGRGLGVGAVTGPVWGGGRGMELAGRLGNFQQARGQYQAVVDALAAGEDVGALEGRAAQIYQQLVGAGREEQARALMERMATLGNGRDLAKRLPLEDVGGALTGPPQPLEDVGGALTGPPARPTASYRLPAPAAGLAAPVGGQMLAQRLGATQGNASQVARRQRLQQMFGARPAWQQALSRRMGL